MTHPPQLAHLRAFSNRLFATCALVNLFLVRRTLLQTAA
jgi:hypothetical protein